ncbi:MAG: LamB/YcsF family protein, partial [Pseudomonadota bacterium]
MTSTIDLNADLGEGGAFDEGLMSVVTSCNIACGGHAGDAQSMREALALAKANGVSPGA